MDYQSLMSYVGTDDETRAQETYAVAEAMVDQYIGNQIVPEVARDRATLEVASELFHRQNAPHGVAQFASYDGSPVRVARDPMVSAYPILNRWMVVGL